jgi:hypothetical protein
MPLLFPGSSEQSIKPPIPASVVDKLAELSTDEPLPDTYPGDRIRLLAQSPRKLYLYWGLSGNPYATLERALGMQSARYSLVLRVVNTENEEHTLHLASPTKSQWFEVEPEQAYRVDLGLYAPGRAFIRLLSSNVAETPRDGVSRSADPSKEWSVSNAQFARILDEAGYVSDALEVTLEALDEATDNSATRTVAQAYGGSDVPPMTEEELVELRRLLAAIALGASFEMVSKVASPVLAEWFAQADQSGEMADASHLVEILRSLLGIEMTQNPLDAATAEAMRRAARVIVGASEVHLPARPFHLWMPSMNPGSLKLIRSVAH